jgi:hypothetical protein
MTATWDSLEGNGVATAGGISSGESFFTLYEWLVILLCLRIRLFRQAEDDRRIPASRCEVYELQVRCRLHLKRQR